MVGPEYDLISQQIVSEMLQGRNSGQKLTSSGAVISLGGVHHVMVGPEYDQNSSKTTKKFFTFDVSTSIRGLHQKKLVLGLLLPVLGVIS